MVEVEIHFVGRHPVRVPNGTDDEIVKSAVERFKLGNPQHYTLTRSGSALWLSTRFEPVGG